MEAQPCTMEKKCMYNSSSVIKKTNPNPIKIENAESSRKAYGFKLFGVWIECPEPLSAEQEAEGNKNDEKPAGEDRNQGDSGICLGEKKLAASDVDNFSVVCRDQS